MDQVSRNRCLSLHPRSTPAWLFSGSETHECLTCTLAIVMSENSIHTVRLAAIHRMKIILQNQKSIEILSKKSSLALVPLVGSILDALKFVSDKDPENVLSFVQEIVSSAFAFDLHLLEWQTFKFCELLMTASVSEIGEGSLMEASTTVMMILLSSVVSEAVQRDDVGTGPFYLSFKCATAGKEITLLSAVADLLISGSSWHDFDVTKASVNVICALVSVHVKIEQSFMKEFATKLAVGFQNAEGTQQQGNLMELAFVLLNSLSSETASHGGKNQGAQNPDVKSFVSKEDVFVCLNKDNALTDILKLCILCPNQSTKTISIKVVEVCCDGSRLIADSLVRDGIADYLFEGLRSHGDDCSDPICCSQSGLYLKALFSIAKQSPHSLSSKWEHCFEIVLNGVAACVSSEVEEFGISILKMAIKSMNGIQLSSVALVTSTLKLVCRIGSQMRGKPSDMNLGLEMDEEFGSMHMFQEALYFLIDYSSLAKFNTYCISLLLEVMELALEQFFEKNLVQKLAKAFIVQIGHLEENSYAAEVNSGNGLRAKALCLIFNRLGGVAAEKVANAAKSEIDQYRLACEAVDFLEILQLGLNSSFLFEESMDACRVSVLRWCWQCISPSAVLIIGNNLGILNGDILRDHRIQVIKDYLHHLLKSEHDAIFKSGVALIPHSSTELEIALGSKSDVLSSKIALCLLERTVELQPRQSHAWVEGALRALVSRISGLRMSESCDEDTFQSACLFFHISSVFEDVSVELKISNGAWLCLVQSAFFSPERQPDLFFYVISKVNNSQVKSTAWEKYAVRDKDRPDHGHILDKKLVAFLRSNFSVMDSICELFVRNDLSEELVHAILAFFTTHDWDNYSPVLALRQFGALQALREAFRRNSVRTRNSGARTKLGANGVMKFETHQLAGLLGLVSESITDWNPEELQQLTLLVCDSLRKTKLTACGTDTGLLLGMLRFLIRLFQSPCENSLTTSRAYVMKACVIGKLTKIMKMQAEDGLSEQHGISHYVSASSACLLVLIMDQLMETGNVEDVLKLYESVPSSSLEWASLVCVLSGYSLIDHAQTCSATNCATLLSTFLEVAKPSFQRTIGSCRVLRSALVSSAISSNILLSNAALNCLIHIVCKAKTKDSRFQQLSMEKSLVDFLTAKLLSKNSGMIRSEVAYVGICIERNLIDISDGSISEALEALRPDDAAENPYGLTKRSIIQLMLTVNQAREKRQLSESIEPVSKNKAETLSTPSANNCVSIARGSQRRILFGVHAIVIA